jgi:tetratricopeptide (TPR) repeat protein
MLKILLHTAFLFVITSVFAVNDNRSVFEHANEAFKSGNYGSAELLFKKIIETDDDEYIDQARFLLARSYFIRKQYQLALFEFKGFLNSCKNEQLSIESRFWMGEALYSLRKYQDSIEEYRRFISRSADNEMTAAAHDRIGDIYLSQNRYDEAIIEWNLAAGRSKSPDLNDMRTYMIGCALNDAGHPDEAIEKLKSLLSQKTDIKISATARLKLGRIYQAQNDHQKALAVLSGIPNNLYKDIPYNETQLLLARSHIALGNLETARTLLELSLITGKDASWYYDALFEQGMILLKSNANEAVKVLETIKNSAFDKRRRSIAALELAKIFIDKDPERAIPYLENALNNEPDGDLREILVFLGRSYTITRQFSKAAEALDLCLEKYPYDHQNDEVLYLRARVYLEQGEFEKSLKVFERLKRENPFSRFIGETPFYMGLINLKKGNTRQSVSMLKEYLSQKTVENRYDALKLLAKSYIQLDDLDSAVRIVDTLIKDYIDYKHVEETILDYATALSKKNKNAQRYMGIITSRFPESDSAVSLNFVIANGYFDGGSYEKAAEFYGRVLKAQRGHRGTAYYRRIQSLYVLKKYAEIIAIVEKGEYPPMNEDQWFMIPLYHARAYYHLKNFDKVYMIIDAENIKKYPLDDVLIYIHGAAHVGDLRSAMNAVDLLQGDKEIYAKGLYLIGESFMKEKNRDEAELFFGRIISECQGTSGFDKAALALGRIRFINGSYKEAYDRAFAVKNESIADQRIALMIESLF